MEFSRQRFWRGVAFGLIVACISANFAAAQPIPTGPASADRVRPEEKVMPIMPREDEPVIEQQELQTQAPPVSGDATPFVLNEVIIENATAFSPEELADIYAPYLGEQITLDVAYQIAGKITERYRANGYFLSLASVMDRNLKAGTITIKVTEGYVGEVELGDDLADRAVVRAYIDRLQEQQPISSEELESFLLRLNDLPGIAFRAVLAKATEIDDEAAVKLVLIPAPKQGRGAISFDNYGSRFLGPNEIVGTYSTSLYPLTQTTVSAITSIPSDELKSGTFEQSIVVMPDVTLGVTGSYTDAAPGYNLEFFEIRSDSASLGIFAKYQWIRQRQENLALKLAVDGRHSTTDILGVPFTRDDIRAIRASMNYDVIDSWRGVNTALLTLAQGLDSLGSSEAGDPNLSRAQAEPDFTKIEANLSRLQGVTDEWSVLLTATGQYASGPLYSSEEFGYGGQAVGRAFDSSEITGDHGVNGSVELRYDGWGTPDPVGFEPYAFVDGGIVWNDDLGQPSRDSGVSAGGGVRFTTNWGMTGNLGVAWALARDISAPIYGSGPEGPRILLQISQGF